MLCGRLYGLGRYRLHPVERTSKDMTISSAYVIKILCEKEFLRHSNKIFSQPGPYQEKLDICQ